MTNDRSTDESGSIWTAMSKAWIFSMLDAESRSNINNKWITLNKWVDASNIEKYHEFAYSILRKGYVFTLPPDTPVYIILTAHSDEGNDDRIGEVNLVLELYYDPSVPTVSCIKLEGEQAMVVLTDTDLLCSGIDTGLDDIKLAELYDTIDGVINSSTPKLEPLVSNTIH